MDNSDDDGDDDDHHGIALSKYVVILCFLKWWWWQIVKVCWQFAIVIVLVDEIIIYEINGGGWQGYYII